MRFKIGSKAMAKNGRGWSKGSVVAINGDEKTGRFVAPGDLATLRCERGYNARRNRAAGQGTFLFRVRAERLEKVT